MGADVICQCERNDRDRKVFKKSCGKCRKTAFKSFFALIGMTFSFVSFLTYIWVHVMTRNYTEDISIKTPFFVFAIVVFYFTIRCHIFLYQLPECNSGNLNRCFYCRFNNYSKCFAQTIDFLGVSFLFKKITVREQVRFQVQ